MSNESMQARFDAMVYEKAEQRRASGHTCISYLSTFYIVALDLLSHLDTEKARADAAEAQVKTLTAERDETDAALVELYDDSRIHVVSLEVMQAYEKSIARAALKLGGETDAG